MRFEFLCLGFYMFFYIFIYYACKLQWLFWKQVVLFCLYCLVRIWCLFVYSKANVFPAEFTQFVNKVRFEALEPTKDATLLIMSAEESDEATYSCKMTLFPSGKVDSRIQLTVWSKAAHTHTYSHRPYWPRRPLHLPLQQLPHLYQLSQPLFLSSKLKLMLTPTLALSYGLSL